MAQQSVNASRIKHFYEAWVASPSVKAVNCLFLDQAKQLTSAANIYEDFGLLLDNYTVMHFVAWAAAEGGGGLGGVLTH
jgi:hypothetical protein